MFDLSGKRAVVTGASSGIGQAIAIALATAGADVASLYLDNPEGAGETQQAIEATGRQAMMIRATSAFPPRSRAWWPRSSMTGAAWTSG